MLGLNFVMFRDFVEGNGGVNNANWKMQDQNSGGGNCVEAGFCVEDEPLAVI